MKKDKFSITVIGLEPKKIKTKLLGGELLTPKGYNKKEFLDRKKRFGIVLRECKKIAKQNQFKLEEIKLLNTKKYE